MHLSPHFSRSEFECGCDCGFATVDYELLNLLEHIRTHFDSPVTITSGCRCTPYNQAIGGAPNSQHLYGAAADIQVSGVEPEIVYQFLDNYAPSKYGLGLYRTWVHVDVRPMKARWDKR